MPVNSRQGDLPYGWVTPLPPGCTVARPPFGRTGDKLDMGFPEEACAARGSSRLCGQGRLQMGLPAKEAGSATGGLDFSRGTEAMFNNGKDLGSLKLFGLKSPD